MFSVNIYGGGRIGKALGLLWRRSNVAEIQDVLCRSSESAEQATVCIGSGTPVTSWSAMRPAAVHLLSVPDDALPSAVEQLSQSVELDGSIVFHTSEWLTSLDLTPAAKKGAKVASVHPIKGFPDPVTAADSSWNLVWCRGGR